jgi:hypothetical protein
MVNRQGYYNESPTDAFSITSKTSSPTLPDDWSMVRFRVRNPTLTITNYLYGAATNEIMQSPDEDDMLTLQIMGAYTSNDEVVDYSSFPYYFGVSAFIYSVGAAPIIMPLTAKSYYRGTPFPDITRYDDYVSRLFVIDTITANAAIYSDFKNYLTKGSIVYPETGEMVTRYGLWTRTHNWNGLCGTFTADVDVYTGSYIMED